MKDFVVKFLAHIYIFSHIESKEVKEFAEYLYHKANLELDFRIQPDAISSVRLKLKLILEEGREWRDFKEITQVSAGGLHLMIDRNDESLLVSMLDVTKNIDAFINYHPSEEILKFKKWITRIIDIHDSLVFLSGITEKQKTMVELYREINEDYSSYIQNILYEMDLVEDRGFKAFSGFLLVPKPNEFIELIRLLANDPGKISEEDINKVKSFIEKATIEYPPLNL